MAEQSKCCLNCRWWEGKREEWDNPDGTCSRIHVGAGNREDDARLYPVGCSAWLETDRSFLCSLFERR